MTRTALLLALPLSYLTTCMPYRHDMVGWEYEAPLSRAGVYEYEASAEEAHAYFLATDSSCVSEGWAVCNYVRAARIELFDDGKATIHEMLIGSAFEPVLPMQTTWHWDYSSDVPLVDLDYWLPIPMAWTPTTDQTTEED